MPSLREMMAAKAGGAKPAPPAKPGGLKVRDPGALMPGEPLAPTKPAAEEGRQLDQVKGEAIPMDYPSDSASPDEKLWWQARHALEENLVIWIEPNSDHAWLAVAPPNKQVAPLVLLSRLPLANNPLDGAPF